MIGPLTGSPPLPPTAEAGATVPATVLPAASSPPLAAGDRLAGVVAVAAGGAVNIVTDEGAIAIRPAVPIADGTPVLLVVLADAPVPRLAVTVLQRSAESPLTVLAPTAKAMAHSAPSPATVGPPSAVVVTAGVTALYPTSPGEAIVLQTLGIAGLSNDPKPAAGDPPLAAGTRLTVGIFTGGPPSSPATVGEDARPLATLNGVVTAVLADGRGIVRVGVGALLLAVPPNVSVGAELTLAVLGAPSAGSAEAASIGVLTPASAKADGEWPALAAAMRWLDGSDPQTARRLRAALQATSATDIVSALVMFAVTLRRGDVRSWLGPSASGRLADARPDLLATLEGDAATLGELATTPDAEGWALINLPLGNDRTIERLRVWYQANPKANDGGCEGDAGGRVVVECASLQCGRLQLDGLWRRQARSLRLLVRSDERLPPAVQSELALLFRAAAMMHQIAGDIAFRVEPPMMISRERPVGADLLV